MDGALMAITTDHSPFTVEEKERARQDIWATPPGAPGVEELLLGVMNEALAGRIQHQPGCRMGLRQRRQAVWDLP